MPLKTKVSISRRDFLKLGIIGAGTLILAKFASYLANEKWNAKEPLVSIADKSGLPAIVKGKEKAFTCGGEGKSVNCFPSGLDDLQKEQLNDFQRSIEYDKIYFKNPGQPLSPSIEKDKVKILSWNIERGYRPEKLAAYLNQIKPDIVCLQEVDWGNQRTGYLDVLEYLAKETSMQGLFGVEFYEIQTSERTSQLAGGGVDGNAILTRFTPLKWYTIELPVLFDWQNPPKEGEKIAAKERRLGNRMAICAEFDFRGARLVICSTHLEDKAGGVEGRFSQCKKIVQCIQACSEAGGKKVIAGDFNTFDGWLPRLLGYSRADQSQGKPWATPECVWWKETLLPDLGLNDSFDCNQWTFQLPFFRSKYDWITMSHARSINQGVGDFNSSDHRPIWVEISWQE